MISDDISFTCSAGKVLEKMQDIDFVKKLLDSDYRTHLPKEIPYPYLEELIARTEFDFPSGKVADQRENGSFNRDNISYQFFPESNKRILVHRFIVAVALGKWPPRDLDVHHINNKPDDNRPTNLELVTRKQNNSVRRAPLKNVADLTKANKWVSGIPKIEKKSANTGTRKSRPSILPPGTPIEAFARVPDQDDSSTELSQLDKRFKPVRLDKYSTSPDSRKAPSLEEVLSRYYSIPNEVSWTGKRKGKDDCYWEATNGTWYYVDPNQ